jgi:hypothetical protein
MLHGLFWYPQSQKSAVMMGSTEKKAGNNLVLEVLLHHHLSFSCCTQSMDELHTTWSIQSKVNNFV